MKNYLKPIIEIINTSKYYILSPSRASQCDCYLYRNHHGCLGCTGNCGCNHWDPEEEVLVPGC